MRSTFGAFYVGKSGLEVARSNLQTSGNNMANATSKGYTRQRVDSYAVGSYNGTMRYATDPKDYIGEGARIDGVSQVRDPYLDVRYRTENSKLGETGAIEGMLTDLGYVFNSATNTEFATQFSDFVKQLQALAESPSDPVTENIVKTSATTILQLFHKQSNELKGCKENAETEFVDNAMLNANSILKNLASLNKEIKAAHVSGNPALELVDKRNVLLDELSQYVDIDISTKPVDIGAGITVDELSVCLTTANGDKFKLVDNDKFRQFDAVVNPNGKFSVQLNDFDGTLVDTSDFGSISLTNGDVSEHLTTGGFRGYLTMLNDTGEFDTPPSTSRGIGYFENMLDSLASQFAKVFNEANSTTSEDKPMFESSVDGEPISASNIKISEKWENSSSGNYITNSKKEHSPGVSDPDDSSNILNMIAQFKADHKYYSTKGSEVFDGSFQECVANMSTTLGLQIKGNKQINDTHKINIAEVENLRESVSGVNLDEEGINLITYNKALTASSRFLTTLDEALDTIISRMGVVGR